jgi:DNA-binding LacI/PurR family transcriptional regulator/signal transduction histidine kinase
VIPTHPQRVHKAPLTARRPVIGLLMNSLFDGYEEALWRGVVDAAEELDVDLLCFLGGALGTASSRSALFDLVSPRMVDGLVMCSGSLGVFTGPRSVVALLERIGEVPVVSVSEHLAGIPSLLIDNAAGISRLTEHLVTEHGHRRIAFVQGPPASSEAQARLRAYREALARCGIAFDASLVLDGDFSHPSGARAVRTLLDERRLQADALLCSNDLMAVAALDELRLRGVQVPGDMAVCGFDDISDAATAIPSLTTARQPLLEMGQEAVRLVMRLIRGESTGDEVRLYPARMVVRRSCGCSRLSGGERLPELAWHEAANAAESLASHLERAYPELALATGVPTWAADLASAIAACPTPAGDRAFLSALERLASAQVRAWLEPTPWYGVLREIMGWARRDKAAPEVCRLASLSEAAHRLVASIASAAEMAIHARHEQETRVLHRLIQPFPFSEHAFLQSLMEILGVLEVPSFFLSHYLGPDRREAVLLAHHDPDEIAELEEVPACFDARRLIPGRFLEHRRRAHVVLPIDSPDGPMGFALCEIGPMNSSGYDVLMHEISMVLSVNDLMAEVQEQHRQLLETARQAGMAEVAVGALHNVGNLLNSVSVSAEEIRSHSAEAGSGLGKACALLSEHAGDLPGFFATDPRAALLPTYFQRANEELSRELERIQLEAEELLEKTGLIRESIRALQDHARGGREMQERETVEIPILVRAALEIQRAHLDRWGVRVQQEMDHVPPLVAPRSKLVHVLVNLVKNAVDAMRTTPESRRCLVLEARQEDGKVRLDVRDSGEGISAENLARIFSYGFTTKRDGHGFGLHTCASYMKQMGGSITVASGGTGQGATFTLFLDPRSGGG